MGAPSFAAIITAAGKSERFAQGKVKKEYLSIDGETVLHRSVAPFVALPSCAIIIVTCPKDDQAECSVALGDLYEHQEVPVILCDGGDTRQESVEKGLQMLKTIGIPVEYVAIHDGARCFVTDDVIIHTLATATLFGGSAPAVPLTDAPKSIDERGVITAHLDRMTTVGVQTPQIFRYPDILEAHEKAKENGKRYIDDTEIFTDNGGKVCLCQGDRNNRKITYMEDIPDAENQIKNYLESKEKGMWARKAAEEFHKSIEESKTRING
jgi:2-C-methyl-D-erythritol 4-phosphate cytidylyltransferase